MKLKYFINKCFQFASVLSDLAKQALWLDNYEWLWQWGNDYKKIKPSGLLKTWRIMIISHLQSSKKTRHGTTNHIQVLNVLKDMEYYEFNTIDTMAQSQYFCTPTPWPLKHIGKRKGLLLKKGHHYNISTHHHMSSPSLASHEINVGDCCSSSSCVTFCYSFSVNHWRHTPRKS